jgi:hypothetical protein
LPAGTSTLFGCVPGTSGNRHPHRQSPTNPVGCVILKLEGDDRLPEEFLRPAEEQIQARQWTQEEVECEEDLVDDDCSESEPKSVPEEVSNRER